MTRIKFIGARYGLRLLLCCSCTVCALQLYSVCAAAVQCVRCSCTVCALQLYSVCAAAVQCVRCSCTVCALQLYSVCQLCTLILGCLYRVHELSCSGIQTQFALFESQLYVYFRGLESIFPRTADI